MPEQRTEQFLFSIVKKIFKVFKETEKEFNSQNSNLTLKLPDNISFISTKDLLKMYSDKSSDERELLYVKEKKAAFIYQIGHKLSDGSVHQFRAFDYDD
ncbi:hypothetical protein PVNG_02423 [Plasmodium vivax North Korean]|uniref:Uncharacterized protein n=1 Tax=Plasmodium vivax North Korean TaxID=1035514 RepID=A0A0J9TKM5_PLAVI|nr:hypothetical protein PVNG_02423 [Plasmodium vivax North Korean]